MADNAAILLSGEIRNPRGSLALLLGLIFSQSCIYLAPDIGGNTFAPVVSQQSPRQLGRTPEKGPSNNLALHSQREAVRIDLDSAVDEDAHLPRVLLLGDSITVGYTHAVRKKLEKRAIVDRCAIGGGSTRDGLARLEGCLGDRRWSVIHFNWGLNDLEREKERLRVPTEQYRLNLERLVMQLKKTGAKLIWATTTPVPVGKVNSPRVAADVPLYNTMAKRVMDENGVPINDLYSFCLPRLEAIQLKGDVHFSEMGYRVLGEEVSEKILKLLE